MEALAVRYAGRDGVTCIPNGIDVEAFLAPADRASEMRSERGIEFRCISIGQLAAWKGYASLLEAIVLVRSSGHPVSFTVLGDDAHGDSGTSLSSMRMRVQGMGLEGVVRFLGHCDDVRPYLAAADVLVHPAYPEPFGRAVVEGMAMGLPVICRAGEHGPAELVRHGLDGLHVRGEGAEELANAILELAGAPERRREMGQNARQRARECFDRRETTALCVRLYRDIVLDGTWGSRLKTVPGCPRRDTGPAPRVPPRAP